MKNQMLHPTAPTARRRLSTWGKRAAGGSLTSVGLRPPSVSLTPLTLIVARHRRTATAPTTTWPPRSHAHARSSRSRQGCSRACKRAIAPRVSLRQRYSFAGLPSPAAHRGSGAPSGLRPSSFVMCSGRWVPSTPEGAPAPALGERKGQRQSSGPLRPTATPAYLRAQGL
jgi:hypothetical protein